MKLEGNAPSLPQPSLLARKITERFFLGGKNTGSVHAS